MFKSSNKQTIFTFWWNNFSWSKNVCAFVSPVWAEAEAGTHQPCPPVQADEWQQKEGHVQRGPCCLSSLKNRDPLQTLLRPTSWILLQKNSQTQSFVISFNSSFHSLHDARVARSMKLSFPKVEVDITDNSTSEDAITSKEAFWNAKDWDLIIVCYLIKTRFC